MSIAAGIAILFGCLSAFLVLALAGALVQRSSLIRQIERLRAEPRVPDAFVGKAILLVSNACEACAAALEEIDRLDGGDSMVVLSSSAIASRPEAIVDIALWNQLYPGFTPCVVEIGQDGRAGPPRPANSQAAMASILKDLAKA